MKKVHDDEFISLEKDEYYKKLKEEKNGKDKRKKTKKETSTKKNDDEIKIQESKQEEKSKINIFFLIISLIVIILYGIKTYLNLDFNNIDLNELIKSGSFVLISLLIVLILFKVNTKKTIPYVIIITLVLIAYSIFSISYASPKVDLYVSDFINKDISEVIDWAEKYKLTLNTLHEYSDTVLKNHVIMQEYGITTLVSDIKSFTITISDGPNYDKEVNVLNLTGMKYDDVIKYIEENHLNNVEFEFILSEEEKDTVISQIGSGNMKRTFSAGNEYESISVKDLKGSSLFMATSYLKRYGINYEIEYQYSNEIEKDYVISQDIVNEVTDNLKLIVSKGKEIKVPNLSKMNNLEIAKWASTNNIKIIYNEVYNKEYESGKIINTSVLENDSIDENSTITITISKGSLIMPSINNISEFKLWALSNNISYEENYEFSDTIKQGELIKSVPNTGDKVTENDTIVLTISKGKSVTVPNFIGLSKAVIESRCKAANLSCTFKYGEYTENTNRDIALNQSKKSGSVVSEGINLTITLSSGIVPKVNVPSFIGKNKSEVSSTCNSLGINCNFTYNNSYSSTKKDVVLSQDKSGNMPKGSTININLSIGEAKTYTVIIDGSLLSLGNPEQTRKTLKSKLENACPGVTFNFSFQPVNSGIGYLNPNSQVKVGSNTLTQGKTYNVIINSN